MIKAKVSTDYKDIERIFVGGSIQKEILKVWSTEADTYVFEAWKILEMEGSLPLTITTNRNSLLDYRIYGNTEQTGTPTPENPIMPTGCRERTENLYNWETDIQYRFITFNGTILSLGASSANYVSDKIHVVAGKTYQLIRPITASGTGLYAAFYDENDAVLSVTTLSLNSSYALEAPTGASYFRTSLKRNNAENDVSMFTEGSTAPTSYIPYGYKLPLTVNGTEYPIYLGEAETTRRIKKLVLTGTEDWTTVIKPIYTYATSITPFVYNSTAMSSHFIQKDFIILANKTFTLSNNKIYIKYNDTTSVDDFKQFLAAQYAAGTPVTVWYVLAEPKTGIVNEPLMKIGDYTDTIDSTQANVQIPTHKGTTVIDYDGEDHFITSDGYELVDKNQNGFLLSGSTLRPSKMYIKYKGR